MEIYYLARQPIFGRDTQIFGYELLYRSEGCPWRANVINGEQATSHVIVNGFWDLGLQKLVGPHCAFINATREFILNPEWLPPPSAQLVLEIMEGIVADEPVITALVELKRRGYSLALDDFTYRPTNRPLLDIADIVKLDVKDLDARQLEEHCDLLRRYPVKLLAEKVETPVEFDRCTELGFDYFQGYFLCKPRMLSGKRVATNRLRALELMAQLQRPEIDARAVETLISQDTGLAYRLLRYINSAAFPTRKKIHSIHHAVVYLGEREIRRWASLVVLAGLDDKPASLLLTALVRARMCELVSQMQEVKCAKCAFMVGLFSLLDAMMDQPMEKVLNGLPFAPEIVEALLRHRGQYAPPLDATLAYERGDWSQLVNLDQSEIARSYVQAVEWAETCFAALNDSAAKAGTAR